MPPPPASFIVVADDSASDVLLLREGLGASGLPYDMHHAGDGDAVCAFVTAAEQEGRFPDLVLLDYHLPRRDGGEVLEALRGSQTVVKNKVVVLTSALSPAACERLVKLGALEVLMKPCDLDGYLRLGERLREVIVSRQDATQP